MTIRTSLIALVTIGLAACSSATPDTQNTGQGQQGVAAGSTPEASEPAPPPPGPAPEEIMKRLDKDGNGVVEGAEIPRFLQDADTNKDGKLTIEELRAHHEQMRARGFGRGGKFGHHGPPPSPEAFLKMLDKDQNGTVTGDEIPKFLADADTNKDGTLTLDELRAHDEKRRAEHFARMDTNKDGALTKDEVGDRHWQMLSVADYDKDGKVTRAELDKAHAEGKLRPPMGGPPHMSPSELVQKFDANKNGTLELSELPEHKRAHLSAADTNKDQILTAEELDAFFRAHHGEHMRMHGGPPPNTEVK